MISFALDDLTNEQQLNLLKNPDQFEVKMNNEVNMKDLITTKQININDNIYQCHMCDNKTRFSQIRIPYACKLLFQEIQQN